MFKSYLKIALLLIILILIGMGWWWFTKPIRYAVFAGYNEDGIIHPYVITYLKELNKVSDGVVYIADSTLNEGEEKKLAGLVIYTQHQRHGEYDFGSYKRGYNWLEKNGYLKKADELILANDSCYAPITSFKPMFSTMAKRKDLDFWGDLQNTRFAPHLQSYFLVLRKRVLNSISFKAFLNSVVHLEHSSLYITEYEVKLTPMLEYLGYKWDSYMPYQKLTYLEDSEKNSYPLTLIKDYNHQFLKRNIFKGKLVNYEDRDALLKYIHEHFPLRYKDIVQEIPERMIPNDLKD